jgi:hypothetical protein
MKLLFFFAAFLCAFQALAQGQISTKILALTGATKRDRTRIYRAVELIETVVNTPEFESRLLDMNYTVEDVTTPGYSQTPLSPQEILASIHEAKENFSGGSPGVIDLKMDMYYEESDTIGYTSVEDPFFHMNRYFHYDYTATQTSGNIFHEWLHKLGHKHTFDVTPDRKHSIPYKLGYLMADMTAEVEAQGDPVLKSVLLGNFLERSFEQCSSHR